MTTGLALLMAAAGLYFVMDMVPSLQKLRTAGPGKLMGNRDAMPELSGWAARAQRAHANLGRSLPIFAILVLSGHALGVTGGGVAVGAHLYFWAYVVHQASYIAGIGPLRSLAWGVAVLGMATVAGAVLAGT